MQQLKEDNRSTMENIRVFVRIRPTLSSEERKTHYTITRNLIYFSKCETEEGKSFQYNQVFHETSTQMEVYMTVAAPIVQKVFNGYNGTIFAYGQSGTGKTHTILGDIHNNELRGIVPNIFTHLLAQIAQSNSQFSYVITVTFLEIYNEEVRDLLSNSSKKLEVRESPELGVFVKDLTGYTIESMEHAIQIINQGNKNRTVGATKLNDLSSRSHAIFSILLEKRDKADNTTTFGKLNLVDLAGSERVAKTKATGTRLKEAGKINLSLSVLGNVISALVDGKSLHIPYRNSKLTRLLEDSIGGTSLTAMVATISPLIFDFEESVYTLMYAERVKHVKNCLKVNKIENKSVLRSFEEKIKELQAELEKLDTQETLKKKQDKESKSGARDVKMCEELKSLQEEKDNLTFKIQTLQKKILVGGENLVEKAQEQMNLIRDSTRKLKFLDSSHQLLQEILYYKEKERDCVEQNFYTLQDENKILDHKIEEIERRIQKAEQVLWDKECEYQNEISSLLHVNKALAKDIDLMTTIVDHFIPNEYVDKLQSNVVYHSGSEDWRVQAVAYCGNHIRNEDKFGIANRKKGKKTNMYRQYKKRK